MSSTMRSQPTGTGGDVLSVVADPEVGSTSLLEHREVGFDLHGTHADVFVEARRRHRVPGLKQDVLQSTPEGEDHAHRPRTGQYPWPASRRDVA
jgi:hypothetical protein